MKLCPLLTLLPLTVLLLEACQSPLSPLPPRPLPAAPPLAPARPAAPDPAPQPPTPAPRTSASLPVASKPRLHRWSWQNVSFQAISYDDRTHCLQVLDQAAGPASQWRDAAAAAASAQALAALNGGYFDPEGQPLGLLRSGGVQRGHLHPSSLGAGVFHSGAAPGEAQLLSRARFQSQRPRTADFLQAGPRLVWQGKPLKGLSAQKTRTRSFLAWDGSHRWLMGTSSATSLAQLATALSKSRPAGWSPRFALNLDGGRSCDFWVSSQVPGGPLHQRSFLAKPVRNFLVLQPRAHSR